MKHITVLLNETVALLQIKEGGVYLDLTLGGGGHSLKIIENLKSGLLISFDLDKDSIVNFENKLTEIGFEKSEENEKVITFKKVDLIVKLVNDNFANLDNYLDKKVDGIIADLGWSTDQLINIEGLSYENEDSSLDMRFDKNLGVKASDLLNALNRAEMAKMFKDYADIYGKYNDQLVEEVIKARSAKLFETVGEFKRVMDKVFLEKNKNGFYSKAFQALRIAVNQELLNLKEILTKGFENLNVGGKLLVITFHSGEAKIVANFFDEKIGEKNAKYLTKKFAEVFLTPTVDELKENINSRSAKMFGVEKL